MYYYRPRYSNGQVVKLSWPIAIYRRFNHLCWPLEENTRRGFIILDHCLTLLGVLIFIFHQDGLFRYIRKNQSDFNVWTKGLPPFIVFHDIFLRCLHGISHKKSLLHILQAFYAKIEISGEKYSELNKLILHQLISTKVITIMYFMTLMGYMHIIFNDLIYQRKDYIHPIIPFCETKALYIFIPVMIIGIWYCFVAGSTAFGHIIIVAELLIHLNARYKILQQDLLKAANNVIHNSDPIEVAIQFKQMLVRIIKRNVELNQFAEQVEKQFTFPLFVIFSISATLLCVLSFMALKNPTAVFYISWIMAKTFELLVIGKLGSTLEETTNNISTMYYLSNWEQAIYKSNNIRENVKLMKIITLAIEINSKPIYLTGMKYFKIHLHTVLKILQGAFSYFTFATSVEM